ncbi:MAG: polysaccharide biosynthesis/export family protein [Terracidiphilus sp.]
MPPASQNLNQPPSNLPSNNRVPPGVSNALHPELTAVPPDFADLKLAPGFLVTLDVLDDPDFDGDFRVDQRGDLALPILGSIHVDGQTASEAREQIQQRLLKDGILNSPQVNLTVVEYAASEVAILGEVTVPGRYPLLAPRSLTDVLALAGGLTVAAGNEIQISHTGTAPQSETIHFSKATSAKVVQDTIVHPGDTVQVKRAGIVYVLGAVFKPGGYVMEEDGTLTLLEAISLADGTTLSASVGTIFLLRREPDGSAVRIELPLNQMQRGKRSDIQLHATDVVYVPNSKLKSAFINTQGILAAATSASIYATAVY